MAGTSLLALLEFLVGGQILLHGIPGVGDALLDGSVFGVSSRLLRGTVATSAELACGLSAGAVAWLGVSAIRRLRTMMSRNRRTE